MTPFKLEIITPEKKFFDGETEQIIVRTTVGDGGILNGHEPYCAALGIGQIRVMVDGKFRHAATAGGVIKVNRNKTVVLVDSCEWADEIDADRAERSLHRAEGILSKKDSSDTELQLAEARLKRALIRKSVAVTRKF